MPIYIILSLLALLSLTPVAAAAQCDVPLTSIKQGMTYSDARAVIISAGWQAPSLSAYGYKDGDDKVVSNCFNSVDICNAYPEIESCSGQGQCLMLFSDAFGNKLEVITYGQLGNGALVTGFNVECS
jgi:hypothetical protein